MPQSLPCRPRVPSSSAGKFGRAGHAGHAGHAGCVRACVLVCVCQVAAAASLPPDSPRALPIMLVLATRPIKFYLDVVQRTVPRTLPIDRAWLGAPPVRRGQAGHVPLALRTLLPSPPLSLSCWCALARGGVCTAGYVALVDAPFVSVLRLTRLPIQVSSARTPRADNCVPVPQAYSASLMLPACRRSPRSLCGLAAAGAARCRRPFTSW